MKQRIQLISNLDEMVKVLSDANDRAFDLNNSGPIIKSLNVVKSTFRSVLKEATSEKTQLHNVLVQRIYTRAIRRCLAVVEPVKYEKVDVDRQINDLRKVISILSDHSTIIKDYSSVQLKYFDSLMSMSKGKDEARLDNIRKQLECIK